MRYDPKEVLLSPTSLCNLSCPHCDVTRRKASLPVTTAKRFLVDCKKAGVERVGFTGGEPFLAPDFLYSITKETVRLGMLFGRITTNGVWGKDPADYDKVLKGLFRNGYDGSFTVSVDAFHRQDLRKLALFIGRALAIWRRPDMVSIASTVGAKEPETERKLLDLSRILQGKLVDLRKPRACIKTRDGFIRISKISLAPIGRARDIIKGWDGRWFREDYCAGPGNVLFVLSNGNVAPCCGYANELPGLCIGNIKRDSAAKILARAGKNRFVSSVFGAGLSRIKKRLEAEGVCFPGKTTNHCFFCNYILTEIPKAILKRSLQNNNPGYR